MTPPIEPAHLREGIALLRSVLLPPQLTDWRSRILLKFEELEAARREDGVATLSRLIAPGQRFVPTASSLTLGAVLSQESVVNWLSQMSQGPTGAWIRDHLGQQVESDLDQAWVRRQYAPQNYPAFHAPHGWHQDGGLGFDYLAYADGVFPPDALLQMVTCWIALGPCGINAPGLELVKRHLDALLASGELKPERVATRFAAEELWRPVLEAGDALLFRGDILHRTHVTPSMTADRMSIELRFFPARNRPPRLKNDRFVPLV
jgi:phytanoyl-CoA dioxygenase PhyH